MLSKDGVLVCVFLLIAYAQAIPANSKVCAGDDVFTCSHGNEFCGETYYKIACPREEEYTYTYKSYVTESATLVRFTQEFTNFDVQDQPICDVSLHYTSVVTYDIIQTQYTETYCFDKPQKVEEITLCFCVEKQVTLAPKVVEITFVYTVVVTERPRKSEYTLTFFYTPPAAVRAISEDVEFTVEVSEAPVLEHTEFSYVVVVTKPPVRRTAVKSYSYEVTQAPVIQDIIFTAEVKAPGKPVYDTIVRRYSAYVTAEARLVTHTDRFTYYVAQSAEVTHLKKSIPYYLTGAVVKKTDVCKFTYYPEVPLQTEPFLVSLTYFAPAPMKLEEFTLDVTAFVYAPAARRAEVFRYTLRRRLPPKLETVTEFEYTSYVSSEQETTTLYKQYTTYVTYQPKIAVSVIPYTDVVYKPLTQMEALFTYTSCSTLPPKDITYCATVTSFMEGGVTLKEFTEHFTYYSNCDVFTKRIPIPYTTFVTLCA